MKKTILIISVLLLLTQLHAQKKGQARTDSLMQVIKTTSQDTIRVRALNTLATDFLGEKNDTAIVLSSSALLLSQKINYTRGEADSYFSIGQIYANKPNATEALDNFEKALKLYEVIKLPSWIAETSYAMGVIYQRSNYDDALRMLKKGLEAAQQSGDKNLMGKIASNIANTYLRMGNYKEAPPYNDLAIKYYTESGNQTGLANCYVTSSRLNHRRGNFQQALKDNYAALAIYEKTSNKVGMYNVYTGIGLIYEDQKNYEEALKSYQAAKKSAEELGLKEVIANAYINSGNAYRELGKLDEALKAFEESLKLSEGVGNKKSIANAQGNLGTIFSRMGRHSDALKSYEQAMRLFEEIGAKESLGIAYFETGSVYYDLKKMDESKQWLEKALQVSKQVQNKDIISKSYQLLMQIDTSKGDYISALQHHQLFITYRDSISNAEAAKQLVEQRMQYEFSKKEDSMRLQQVLIAEQLEKQTLLTQQQQQELKLKQASLDLAQREKDLQMLRFLKTQADLQLSNEQNEKKLALAEQEKAIQQSRLDKQTLLATQNEKSLLLKDKQLTAQRSLRNLLIAGATGFLLLSFFIFLNYRNQRKANIQLKEQKEKTEEALKELKATQTQLIHSEKMASLGELTAGIAHEIQNPLNFVNNFSELNNEMLEEMKLGLKSGNFEDVLVIAEDIRENNSKITHHGKRAEGIVKGMLQHSRSGTRKKELININSLADEYLRLSYHGLRAKDKNFHAAFTTNFDENIGKVDVVPQEIGRVLLNVYNNAFYAVNEKKKQSGEGYEPLIAVTTKKSANRIEISISDNGTGIPPKALDKIYQPFFTTKPPGQGTGLGLSLSYDIVKAHGGDLKVETKEGEFTRFIIQLPVSNNKAILN